MGVQAVSNVVPIGIVHEPDEMGVHSDIDGFVVWLPRSKYPTREQARAWYVNFTGELWIEVHVLSRWMRHAPEDPAASEFDGEFWIECEPEEPGAFRVWRCE